MLLRGGRSPHQNEFGITVTPKLITVPGRVLTGPDVKYRNGEIARTRLGSWNMQSIQFSTSATLPSWTYLLLSPEGWPDAWNSEPELRTTLNAFQSKLKELGINANNYAPGLRVTLSAANADTEIDAAIQKFVSHPTKPAPKLILVIMPYVDGSIYNRVKFICDVKKGLLNYASLDPSLQRTGTISISPTWRSSSTSNLVGEISSWTTRDWA